VKSAKSDTAKLQGTWNVTALEVDGQPVAAGGQIVVKGDRFTSLGVGFTYEGKLLIDAMKKPGTIDMLFTKGPEKGNTNRGIFEFTGKNSWRLCLQMTGKDRPKKFTTLAGRGLALETLVRAGKSRGGARLGSAGSAAVQAKAKKSKAITLPPDFPTDRVPELEGEWQMTALSHNGEPLEAAYCKIGKRFASGNETAVFMGPQTILKAFYAINRGVHPNTMDYVLAHGPAAGKKQFGIFEQMGDSFTVSFSPPGQPRPPDFSSTRGDGRTVTTWKRK
jgi:uncharacterized protein (TIGR03067 family)